MFTLITSAFCCSSPIDNPEDQNTKVFQRERLQNIASAIDIIMGFGLIAAGFAMHMPVLTMVGALQLWPLLAFITLTLFSCKEGLQKENFHINFRRCCSTKPELNSDSQ